jgi:hypothetical protein
MILLLSVQSFENPVYEVLYEKLPGFIKFR